MFYFVKTPWIVKKIYAGYTWHINTSEKELYLTFDDGPHPVATPVVLKLLKQYNALATFFCIGKNVERYPEIYRQVLAEGHSVGNHTFHHYNGWKTNDDLYLKDIAAASRLIDSNLFRPPYGRITSFQAKHIHAAMKGRKSKIIMWDVLSADFDIYKTGSECMSNVVLHAGPGSIIVFHDSEKALSRLEYALPRVLHHFSEKGYSFRSLE